MRYKTLGGALLAASILAGTPGCSSIPFGSSRRPHITTARLTEIGRTFESQGRYQKARQMYNTVLRRQPQNQESLARLDEINAIERGDSPMPPKGFHPGMKRDIQIAERSRLNRVPPAPAANVQQAFIVDRSAFKSVGTRTIEQHNRTLGRLSSERGTLAFNLFQHTEFLVVERDDR